jgi:uncharacterized protein
MFDSLAAAPARIVCDICEMPFWLAGLLGGILIGLAAALLLFSTGRVAGVSGIAAGALPPARGDLAWRLAFIGGLVGGGLLLQPFFPAGVARGSTALLVGAGLLVGFGTRLAGGCTSGHGVCGVGRGSVRSIVATVTFVAAGMITVAVVQ